MQQKRNSISRFAHTANPSRSQKLIGEAAAALEELAPASRYRTLLALKSLLAFGHRIGYLPLDVGRVLHLADVGGDQPVFSVAEKADGRRPAHSDR